MVPKDRYSNWQSSENKVLKFVMGSHLSRLLVKEKLQCKRKICSTIEQKPWAFNQLNLTDYNRTTFVTIRLNHIKQVTM